MALDYKNYRIVWPTDRGKGHLFSIEANNIMCSRGARSGESRLEKLYSEAMRPERAAKITCSNCRRNILKYDRGFLTREP